MRRWFYTDRKRFCSLCTWRLGKSTHQFIDDAKSIPYTKSDPHSPTLWPVSKQHNGRSPLVGC